MLKELWRLTPPIIKKPFSAIRDYLAGGRVVYQTTTPYSQIKVIDKKGKRYLVFAETANPFFAQKPELVYQSYIDLSKPKNSSAPYAQYFQLAPLFKSKLQKALMIGLGGGTVAREFLKHFPTLQFKTVEIDSEVVEIAHKYFFLPKDPRHVIVVGDGRKYLEETREKWDLVLMDAFFARTIPYPLFTKEFFKQVDNNLRTDGILAINFNGALKGRKSFLYKTIYKTLHTIFPNIYVFANKKDTPEEMQNIIFFVSKEGNRLTPELIMAKGRDLFSKNKDLRHLMDKVKHLVNQQVYLEDVTILVDRDCPLNKSLDLYTHLKE